MIDISDKDLHLVKEILTMHVPDCEVRVFGSRYKGNAREYSDLDLVIIGKVNLEWQKLADLKEAFDESDLSFRVDILDWNALSSSFRDVIQKSGYEVIQSGLNC